jgi:riboflavin kinase/FMN adenylyltransferase
MRPSGSKDANFHEKETSQPRAEGIGRLVAIGNFDGVHRGHRWVLSRASEQANARGLKPCVLTFDPHPAVVLGRALRAPLTTPECKSELLLQCVPGLEVIVLPFTRELASLSPRNFAQCILRERLDARAVLVGENFRFGRDRAGDLEALRNLGGELGFDAWAETLRGDDGGVYSSTRTRELLALGKVEMAAEVLGRPHRLFGDVIHGAQRGRQLGFPTANLAGVRETLPADGVYAVEVSVAGASDEAGGSKHEGVFPGVANIGARPTVGEPHAVEVHLLEFEGNLYGRTLGVSLLHRLRSVQKFDGVDALTRQIASDIATARRMVFSMPRVGSLK